MNEPVELREAAASISADLVEGGRRVTIETITFPITAESAAAEQPTQPKSLLANAREAARAQSNSAFGSTRVLELEQLATFKGNQAQVPIKQARLKKGQLAPLVGAISASAAADTRNSLESISSKFSTSSANDDSQLHHQTPELSDSPTGSSLGQPTPSVSPELHHQDALQTIELADDEGNSPPVLRTLADLAMISDSSGFKNAEDNNNNNNIQKRGSSQHSNNPAERVPNSKGLQSDESQRSNSHLSEGLVGAKCANGTRKDPEDAEMGLKSAKDNQQTTGKTTATTTKGAQQPPKPPFMFAGIAASIVASIFFSFSILFIKLLPEVEGFQEKSKALFFRGAFMMLLCGSTILTTNSTFRVQRNELWVNILRAIFGTCGVFGSYCALKYISMGDSTALVFSSPIWTSLLSYFILNERLQWLQLFALPASIFGIVLIAHPALIVNVDHLAIDTGPIHHHHSHLINATINNHNITISDQEAFPVLTNELVSDFEHRWPGIVISLFTSLLVSCTYIVLKFRKTTPIQTTTFWLGFTTFFTSIAIMSAIGFGQVPDTWSEWGLLTGSGVCSWLGQSLLQWAFQYEDAGILSIVRTLDVALMFVLSALFLDDEIYWTSIVGATIIGLVVISMMLNNWHSKMRTTANRHQQLDDANSEIGKQLSRHHSAPKSMISLVSNNNNNNDLNGNSISSSNRVGSKDVSDDRSAPYIIQAKA